MMDRYVFPAVFEPNDTEEGYTVTFPDLPGCITEGDTWEVAHRRAQDTLEGFLWGMEHDGDPVPLPTPVPKVIRPPKAILTMVEAWMPGVRDEMANKAVNKTVTLPRWLKDAADREHINVSQVLQTALKQRLGIMDGDSNSRHG
jgi:predicted RNase H-like HicB family nuclease